MTLSEEVLQAATMKVGLSSYVATAALAVMAGTLVIYTFIASTFDEPWYFHVLTLVGLGLLVLSVVVGGRESDRVIRAVGVGTWKPKDLSDKRKARDLSDSEKPKGVLDGRGGGHNLQAILTLCGLMVVTVATVSGVVSESEESRTDERVDDLVRQVQTMSGEAAAAQKRADRLAHDVRSLQRSLDR